MHLWPCPFFAGEKGQMARPYSLPPSAIAGMVGTAPKLAWIRTFPTWSGDILAPAAASDLMVGITVLAFDHACYYPGPAGRDSSMLHIRVDELFPGAVREARVPHLV